MIVFDEVEPAIARQFWDEIHKKKNIELVILQEKRLKNS